MTMASTTKSVNYYILCRHKLSFKFISFLFSVSFREFPGKLFLAYLVVCTCDQKGLYDSAVVEGPLMKDLLELP